MSNCSVTKSISERYEIKLNNHAWAIITISEDGDLNVISDYGNYSYSWRSFGDSFKKFLIRICEKDSSYLYSKLHDRHKAKMVDCEKTVEQFKKDLFKFYREKKRDYWYMKKDENLIYPRLSDKVRDAYESLCSLETEGMISHDLFMNQIWHDKNLSDELFGEEYFMYANIITTGDMGCEAFCREFAPVFAEILKEELRSENR